MHVSVVIVSFQREATLLKTIEDLLGQTTPLTTLRSWIRTRHRFSLFATWPRTSAAAFGCYTYVRRTRLRREM